MSKQAQDDKFDWQYPEASPDEWAKDTIEQHEDNEFGEYVIESDIADKELQFD